VVSSYPVYAKLNSRPLSRIGSGYSSTNEAGKPKAAPMRNPELFEDCAS
jgi:hypothetical protein